MLFITTYATRSYCYAMPEQRGAILRALLYAGIKPNEVGFIMAGDGSPESSKEYEGHVKGIKFAQTAYVTSNLPENKEVKHNDTGCLLIADMQAKAWERALSLGADKVWSLESDIIPSAKTLRCMIDTLAFDKGWYDVAMCTYPNTEFLGGEGTENRWILPSVYPEERELADSVIVRMEAKKVREKELTDKKEKPSEEDLEEWKALDRDIENSPPKGNVWELNAKFGYKPRGWLSSRYPAIGLGAILPTGWTGLGCTLMSNRAVHLADFSGYTGKGTQDLYLGRRCWIPNGLRLSVITHALCDHVKRTDAGFIRHTAFHSSDKGSEGHLRSVPIPFTPTNSAVHESQGKKLK